MPGTKTRLFAGLAGGFGLGLVVLGLLLAVLSQNGMLPADLGAVFGSRTQPSVIASTTKPDVQDDPRLLARALIQKTNTLAGMQERLLASRNLMVTVMTQKGATATQAAIIADKYMIPEFQVRLPELGLLFENAIVQDFTVQELRATLNNETNDARRSAQVKAGQLPERFRKIGEEWGAKVGTDAIRKNQSEINKLGPIGMGVLR